MRFHTKSRATASRVIATIAMNVSGALRNVSTAKKASTTAVDAIACQHDRRDRARIRAPPVGGDADEEEDHERAGAPDRGDRGEIDEIADHEHDSRRDQHAPMRPSREPRPKMGGNWPAPASIPVRPPEA